jgi:hypothetical protein
MLDIRKFGSQRFHGDLVSFLTFQNGERWLVIKSQTRPTARPVAIPDRYAHMLAKPDGKPTDYLLAMAATYAVVLGHEQTDYHAPLKVIDIIMDRTQELIELRPEIEQREAQGVEYRIKIDGQTVAEGEG